MSNHTRRTTLPLVAAVLALAAAPQTAPMPAFQRAVADPARPEKDRGRDADRRPIEVLAFLGIEPGMQVGDAMAASGYYTEILARGLGPDGRVWAHNTPKTDGFFGENLRRRLSRLETGNIEQIVGAVEAPGFPEGQLDAVLLIRFYHDFCWFESDRPGFNRAVLAALKPGGVFGVVDHHALPGTGCSVGQSLHRIEAEMVKKEILAAGFVLEAESSLLANPDDTHDWNIFADKAARRDRTDRFLLRFRKPETPPAR